MIDIHCHLEYLENSKEIIREAKNRGMKALISSVAEPKDAEKILVLKKEFPDFLFISLGFHPENVSKYTEKEIFEYQNLIRKNKEKIVAIGEIGLDYFYPISEKEKEKSKEVFKRFLELSKEENLPVVIHCRQAFKDVFEILKENRVEKVCLHCFSGSESDLKEALERGYFISFATNLCYTKKHPRLAQKTPIEKILLETDIPWLDPESPKTLTNRPWKILFSAKILARLKNISLDKILRVTNQNAQKFFSLWTHQ